MTVVEREPSIKFMSFLPIDFPGFLGSGENIGPTVADAYPEFDAIS